MKNVKLFLSALLIGGLIFTACTQEEDMPTQDENSTTSEDLVTLQNIVEDTEEEIDYQLETRDPQSGDCPTVTITPDDGTYPKDVVIDYGTDGCEGPHGRIRTGKILINISAPMQETGAVRSVTFEDFTIDDVAVAGSRSLTNLGENADGQPTFNRLVEMEITYPTDQTASWETDHLITHVEGYNTPEWIDNVFHIEGSSSGVNRIDVPFESIITEPLVRKRPCRWIVNGTREVTVNGYTRTIDYGEGNCDRFAEVTWPNGFSKTVLIRRWW